MPAAKKTCVKCEKAMERGYVTRPWPQQPRQIEMWVKGNPPAPWLIGKKSTMKNVREVTSWRCTGCGYLESYAG